MDIRLDISSTTLCATFEGEFPSLHISFHGTNSNAIFTTNFTKILALFQHSILVHDVPVHLFWQDLSKYCQMVQLQSVRAFLCHKLALSKTTSWLTSFCYVLSPNLERHLLMHAFPIVSVTSTRNIFNCEHHFFATCFSNCKHCLASYSLPVTSTILPCALFHMRLPFYAVSSSNCKHHLILHHACASNHKLFLKRCLLPNHFI